MSDIKDKYEALRLKTEQDVQKLYPGKKVKVVFHGETRTKEQQHSHKEAGRSTTNASLHMVGGARDFNIIVDGRVLGNSKSDFKVYKETLWKNANDTGLFHLEEDGFGRTDPYHVGLIKEKGDGTAFKRLFKAYPQLTKDKGVQASLKDLNAYKTKNPKDTIYDNIINAYNETSEGLVASEKERKAEIKHRVSEAKEKLLKSLKGSSPEESKKIIANYQKALGERVDKKSTVLNVSQGGESKPAENITESKETYPPVKEKSQDNFQKSYDKRKLKKELVGKSPDEQKKILANYKKNSGMFKGGAKSETESKVVKKEKPMANTKETPTETTIDEELFKEGMTDAEKSKRVGKFKKDYAKKKARLEFLEQRYPDGEETKKLKKYLESGERAVVQHHQDQRALQLEKDIAQADKDEDYDLAKKLDLEEKEFNENRIDFTKTTKELEVNPAFLTSTKEHTEPGKKTGKKVLDVNQGDIHSAYNEIIETDASTQEQEEEEGAHETPMVDKPGSGSGGGGTGGAEEDPQINDLDVLGDTITTTSGEVDDINVDTDDYLAQAEERREQINKLQALQSDKFVHDYAPDSQNDRDVLGNLMDAGRGVAGMIGAMKEVPEYERGTMFQTAMGEAEKRREMGLSADELNYRNQQAETAYAYDIKNVRRGAGGSSGAYLGNLGRAQSQLYQNYGQTAALDEGVRRQNRANFQQMALQDENINRRIFEDELSQTMATKQAGASLVQDAISNIKERSDYNKQYGKDSPWYNYMRSLDKDKQSSAFYREKEQETATADAIRKLKLEEAILREKAEKGTNITGGPEDAEVTQQIVEDNKAKVQKESANVVTPADAVTTETGTPLIESIFNKDAKTQQGLIEEGKAEIVEDETLPPEYKNTVFSTEKPIKEREEREDSYTETDKHGNVQTFDSQEKVSKTIKENIKKAEPGENKKRYAEMVENAKYGPVTDAEVSEMKELEKAKKNGWVFPDEDEEAVVDDIDMDSIDNFINEGNTDDFNPYKNKKDMDSINNIIKNLNKKKRKSTGESKKKLIELIKKYENAIEIHRPAN